MFGKEGGYLALTQIDTDSFDPARAAELSKTNRALKLLGSTGDTSVLFIDKRNVSIAIKYVVAMLEKEFGTLEIGMDFFPSPLNPPAVPELGFRRIPDPHITIGSLQVIDAQTKEDWNTRVLEGNASGVKFSPDDIADAYKSTMPFPLKFQSIKLTPNGMVVVQFKPSDELLILRKALQASGAKLKYASEAQMGTTAITLGYFPNIVNAEASQLVMLKEKFISLCQTIYPSKVRHLTSDVLVVAQEISYVKFARNDLGIAEKTPMINGKGQLTSACNSSYPIELVTLRETLRHSAEDDENHRKKLYVG